MQPILDTFYGIILSITGLFIDNPDVWLQTGENGHPPPLYLILFLLGVVGFPLGWWISSYLRDLPAIIFTVEGAVLLYGLLAWNMAIIGGSLIIMILTFSAFRDPQLKRNNELMDIEYKRRK